MSHWPSPLLLVSLLALPLAAPLQAAEPTPAPREKAPPIITPARDTTFFTEPRWPDGTIDYAGALNREMSRGATLQNNGVVPYLQAMGPALFAKEPDRERIYRQVGMQEPPAVGNYWVSWQDHITKEKADADAANKQFERALASPWSESDAPLAAAWLAKNKEPLALCVEASRRTHWFRPLPAQQGDMLLATLLPDVQNLREVASSLTMRARLRMQQNDLTGASADLVAVVRLGRLCGRSCFAVGLLVGYALEAIGEAGIHDLLKHPRLTAKQAADLLAEFGRLPERPSSEQMLLVGERSCTLDAVQHIALRPDTLNEIAGGAAPRNRSFEPGKIAQLTMFYAAIDWNEVLRVMNAAFDEMGTAMSIKDPKARLEKLAALDSAMHERRETHFHPWVIATSYLGKPDVRKTNGRWMGGMFSYLLLPALQSLSHAEVRTQARSEATRLAVAAAVYRAETGKYPEALKDLVPKHLKELPRDPYTGNDFTYRRTDRGFRLYSLGLNGKDNGGPAKEGEFADPREADWGVVVE